MTIFFIIKILYSIIIYIMFHVQDNSKCLHMKTLKSSLVKLKIDRHMVKKHKTDEMHEIIAAVHGGRLLKYRFLKSI